MTFENTQFAGRLSGIGLNIPCPIYLQTSRSSTVPSGLGALHCPWYMEHEMKSMVLIERVEKKGKKRRQDVRKVKYSPASGFALCVHGLGPHHYVLP